MRICKYVLACVLAGSGLAVIGAENQPTHPHAAIAASVGSGGSGGGFGGGGMVSAEADPAGIAISSIEPTADEEQ